MGMNQAKLQVLSGSTLKETERLVLDHEPLNTPAR